jgi:SAM-dependent methyltransferase
LLGEAALERSSVAANCAMNRERGLAGPNSYAKELDFDPLDWVRGRPDATWLDLCCGSGRALIEASRRLAAMDEPDGVRLIGVDLVDYFAPPGDDLRVELVTASIGSWQPTGTFDLITCVHGLHYVGDKLGALARAVNWLRPGGLFVADLDLANVRVPVGGRGLAAHLRAQRVGYDARHHRITCEGPRKLELPYEYLGADDHAGPNYTGQPVVDSHYR